MALPAIGAAAALVIPYIPDIVAVFERLIGVTDKSKAGRILAILQSAAGAVPTALEAVKAIRATFESGEEPTVEQLRALQAEIIANHSDIHNLAQQIETAG